MPLGPVCAWDEIQDTLLGNALMEFIAVMCDLASSFTSQIRFQNEI